MQKYYCKNKLCSLQKCTDKLLFICICKQTMHPSSSFLLTGQWLLPTRHIYIYILHIHSRLCASKIGEGLLKLTRKIKMINIMVRNKDLNPIFNLFRCFIQGFTWLFGRCHLGQVLPCWAQNSTLLSSTFCPSTSQPVASNTNGWHGN